MDVSRGTNPIGRSGKRKQPLLLLHFLEPEAIEHELLANHTRWDDIWGFHTLHGVEPLCSITPTIRTDCVAICNLSERSSIHAPRLQRVEACAGAQPGSNLA
jgi:hypothetical protein